MNQTLQDIQIKHDKPISIVYDNTSAMRISKNIVMHSKTKHIPIKFHFLWEKIPENNIKLEYIGTKEQIIDIFTRTKTCIPSLLYSFYIYCIYSTLYSFPTFIHTTFCKEYRGRRIVSGSYPFSIDVKGGEKYLKQEDGGRNGHRGSVSVAINSKGGDCWKFFCH